MLRRPLWGNKPVMLMLMNKVLERDGVRDHGHRFGCPTPLGDVAQLWHMAVETLSTSGELLELTADAVREASRHPFVNHVNAI